MIQDYDSFLRALERSLAHLNPGVRPFVGKGGHLRIGNPERGDTGICLVAWVAMNRDMRSHRDMSLRQMAQRGKIDIGVATMIVAASDNRFDHDPDLRRELLIACGISEGATPWRRKRKTGKQETRELVAA